MKNIDNLKSAWQQNNQHVNQQLTERQIMYYLNQQSTDISSLFRKGLVTDIIFKSALLLASIGLIIIYQSQTTAMGLSIILAVLSVLFVSIQSYYYVQARSIDDPTVDTKTLLQIKINYFYQKFIKAIYLSALSSPIMVLCGSLYYYYFKYGFIKPMNAEDMLVLGVMLLISFVFSLVAYRYQYKFHVQQLESSLQNLQEGDLDKQTIRDQQKQRKILLLITGALLILGLLVLVFIIF